MKCKYRYYVMKFVRVSTGTVVRIAKRYRPGATPAKMLSDMHIEAVKLRGGPWVGEMYRVKRDAFLELVGDLE